MVNTVEEKKTAFKMVHLACGISKPCRTRGRPAEKASLNRVSYSKSLSSISVKFCALKTAARSSKRPVCKVSFNLIKREISAGCSNFLKIYCKEVN